MKTYVSLLALSLFFGSSSLLSAAAEPDSLTPLNAMKDGDSVNNNQESEAEGDSPLVSFVSSQPKDPSGEPEHPWEKTEKTILGKPQ